MNPVTIGFAIILASIVGAWFIGLLRDSHNQTTIPFESLYDCERLDQLINISGGGSLAQLVRLYKIRGRELEKARKDGYGYYRIRLLLRDRILLLREINRLESIQTEKESSLLILTH